MFQGLEASFLLFSGDATHLLYCFLAMPLSFWDLSSLARDRTSAPGSESRVLTTGPPGDSQTLLSLLFVFAKLEMLAPRNIF